MRCRWLPACARCVDAGPLGGLRLVFLQILWVPALALAAASAPGPLSVRFAPEADYGPFIYREADGRIAGLSMDWLQALAPLAGWQLVVLPPRALADNLAAARRGEVDLLSSLRPTPERAAYLGFTRAYAQVPAVLVRRADQPARTLEALQGQAVAVGRGYAVEEHVRRHHPQVRWTAVDDDAQALAQLRAGQVQAAVLDIASARFVIARDRLEGLVIGGPIGFDYALSFAYRKDRPELGQALDAAMAALPPPRVREITARWMPDTLTQVQDPLRERLRNAGLAMLAAGLLGGAGWWWRMRRAQAGPRADSGGPGLGPP